MGELAEEPKRDIAWLESRTTEPRHNTAKESNRDQLKSQTMTRLVKINQNVSATIRMYADIHYIYRQTVSYLSMWDKSLKSKNSGRSDQKSIIYSKPWGEGIYSICKWARECVWERNTENNSELTQWWLWECQWHSSTTKSERKKRKKKSVTEKKTRLNREALEA